MRARRTALLVAMLGVAAILLLAAAAYRAAAPESSLRQQIAAALPLGSTRAQVEENLQEHEMIDVPAFDYPPGDPRQGRHLLTRTHRWWPLQDAYLLFWFDKAGEQGRLTSLQVSEDPIRMPPP